MNKIQELSIAAVKDACHKYWIDKDMSSFFDFSASVDIPRIGVCNPAWSGFYVITSEHYNAYEQSEELCLVFAKIALKDNRDFDSEEFIADATIMCMLKEEGVRFTSIHISREDGNQLVSERNQQAYSYYRKSLSYAFDVILEYQMLNNEFIYDRDRYRELFEVNTNFVNMDQWFWHMCTESIHPEDTEHMDIFRDMDVRKRIANNNNVVYKNVRIKNQKKGYIWIRLTIIFIPNQRNTNIDRIFIFIKNIDDDMRENLSTLSMARVDSLTGIWNRYYTESLINTHLESEQTGIFILMDVDKFKQVNDCYGHITGDEILVTIARRVTGAISKEDVFGRIGGDEFVLFLRKIGSEKENMARISRVLNAIQFDYSEYGLDMSIHCSAGVTNAGPLRNTFAELYASADKALYEAKAAGRNTFRVLT